MSLDIKPTCEDCNKKTMFFVDNKHSFCEEHREIYLRKQAEKETTSPIDTFEKAESDKAEKRLPVTRKYHKHRKK
jgi:hypothetical protein